ncbi:MAG: hypothetical protein PHC70_03090 [Patescibacteria group bacterium]|nr:hypothetical protein [Patescibacteria group bacterium]
MKSNKSQNILIAILIILVLGLSGTNIYLVKKYKNATELSPTQTQSQGSSSLTKEEQEMDFWASTLFHSVWATGDYMFVSNPATVADSVPFSLTAGHSTKVTISNLSYSIKVIEINPISEVNREFAARISVDGKEQWVYPRVNRVGVGTKINIPGVVIDPKTGDVLPEIKVQYDYMNLFIPGIYNGRVYMLATPKQNN